MAISKFTQPIRASAITPRPRVNLGIVSQTLDRLSGQQREGEEARTKFQLLGQELRKNVIPGEEGLADELLQKHELGIETMAQDADLINAGSRIRARTAELTGEFSQLSENAVVLADVRNRANEMTEKGDLTRADRFFAIEDTLAQHKPGERFAPGQLHKKIDIPKFLKENLTNFRTDKNELVELSANGEWINTVTQEEVSPEEVEAAGRLLIENDPGIRRQLSQQSRFDLRQNPEFVDQQVRAQVDAFEDQRSNIINDSSLDEKEKKRQIKIIDDNQDALVEDPERFIVGADVENRIDRLIAPNVLREAGTKISKKSTANPFALANLRASLSGSGKGGGAYFPTGPERQVKVGSFDRTMSADQNIETDEAILSTLDQQISQTSGIEQQRLIQDRDQVLQSLGQKKFLRNRILRQGGVSEDRYNEILNSKPDPTRFGISKETSVYLQNNARSLTEPSGGSTQFTSGPGTELFTKGINFRDAKNYLEALDKWEDDLGAESDRILKIVDKGLDAMPKTTASRTLSLDAKEEREVLRQTNALDNVGKMVINQKTGNPVTKNIPDFKEIVIDAFPIDGKYHATAKDKDGEAFTVIYTDTRAMGDFLASEFSEARIGGQSITSVPFAADVMGLPDGEAIPIFFSGEAVLGEDRFLELKKGIYRIVNSTGEPVEDTFELTDQEDVIGAIQEFAFQR